MLKLSVIAACAVIVRIPPCGVTVLFADSQPPKEARLSSLRDIPLSTSLKGSCCYIVNLHVSVVERGINACGSRNYVVRIGEC